MGLSHRNAEGVGWGVDWYYRATPSARVIEGSDLLYSFQLVPSLPEVNSH